jgi:hypothetical protein
MKKKDEKRSKAHTTCIEHTFGNKRCELTDLLIDVVSAASLDSIMALTAPSTFFTCDDRPDNPRLSACSLRKENDDSLFGSCIMGWVCSNVFGTDTTSTGCAVTAKGARAETIWCWEGKLLMPGTGRVHGEWGDGKGRGGLAVRGYEDSMWVCTVPRGGYRTDATTFGTGRACGATMGGWRLGGSRWTRARTGTSISRLGTGVVHWRVVRRWWWITWIVSKGGREGGEAIVVVWRWMSGGIRVGIGVRVVEGGGEWG